MSHAPSIGSASRALGLLEERESKGDDACANEQSDQFVTRHEVPNSTKTSGQSSTGRGQHSGDGNSLLKSFLLPKKVLWLRELESNQQLQVQSLSCFHYTIPRNCFREITRHAH